MGVICRNQENVDVLRDERIDDRDLLLDGGRGRARIDELDIAKLLRRLLPAVTSDVEIVDAENLDDHGDAQLLLRESCSRELRKRRARRQTGSQAFRDLSTIEVHCLILPVSFLGRVGRLERSEPRAATAASPCAAHTNARHTSGTNPKPVARRSIWPIAGKSKWVPATRIRSVAAMSSARFRVATAWSRSTSSTVPACRRRHLQVRHMHDVAPDHDGFASRLDQPGGLAGRMPRLGESGHARKHRTVANCANAVSVGRNRKSRALEEFECLRWRPAGRIRIAEEIELRLVHDELRVREDSLSVLVDEAVHVVGVKMSYQDRVDVFRLDTHGSQIVGEHSEGRPHADTAACVDEHAPTRHLHQECIHRHLWRNGPESGLLEPLALRMGDPDDEIE